MITRMALRCPGCESEFTLRLGVSNWDDARFYVLCPHCSVPIRGRQSGDSLPTYRVELEADTFNAAAGEEPQPVITVNPEVPSRYDADSLDADDSNLMLGAFPTMTLIYLLGSENWDDFQTCSQGALHVHNDVWPKVFRLLDYYLADNADLMTKTLAQLDPELGAASTATRHERATAANHVLGQVLNWMIGSRSETPKFMHRYLMKHQAALTKSSAYRELAKSLEAQGALPGLQRAIIEQLDNFVKRAGSWHMGILTRYTLDERRDDLDKLRMYRDEFGLLQNLYVQGFELVSKTLRFPVAAQNTIMRGDPDDFGTQPAVGAPNNKANPPKNLKQFDKLPNADKLCYIRQIPGMETWAGYLDNKMRNSIGHASARHDLRLNTIVNDKDSTSISYLQLMSAVFDVFDALATAAQVLRTQRVMGSPDF